MPSSRPEIVPCSRNTASGPLEPGLGQRNRQKITVTPRYRHAGSYTAFQRLQQARYRGPSEKALSLQSLSHFFNQVEIRCQPRHDVKCPIASQMHDPGSSEGMPVNQQAI